MSPEGAIIELLHILLLKLVNPLINLRKKLFPAHIGHPLLFLFGRLWLLPGLRHTNTSHRGEAAQQPEKMEALIGFAQTTPTTAPGSIDKAGGNACFHSAVYDHSLIHIHTTVEALEFG